jgi:hypothetical protein
MAMRELYYTLFSPEVKGQVTVIKHEKLDPAKTREVLMTFSQNLVFI